MSVKLKQKKTPAGKWVPYRDVDAFGQGLWRKGPLQCWVTARRLTITHQSRVPTESDLRDALNVFWDSWKGLAAGQCIAEIPQTVHGIAARIVHFFRLDLYEHPDIDITAELESLGARVAWTANGAVPLADNEAHARVAMVPHGSDGEST